VVTKEWQSGFYKSLSDLGDAGARLHVDESGKRDGTLEEFTRRTWKPGKVQPYGTFSLCAELTASSIL